MKKNNVEFNPSVTGPVDVETFNKGFKAQARPRPNKESFFKYPM